MLLKPADVQDAESFAAFVQQRYGCPYPTIKGMATLKRNAKLLFKEHPDASWQTLVQVAQWCHGKGRRMAHAYQYVAQFRWAYADGAINIRPPIEVELDGQINAILMSESDEKWRERLIRADGAEAKAEIIEEYLRRDS